MDDEKYYCLCGVIYDEKEFTKHHRICKHFKKKFNYFDTKLSSILKYYSKNNENNLIFIRFLLEQYIKLLNLKLNDSNNNKNIFKKEINKTLPNKLNEKLVIKKKYSIKRIISFEILSQKTDFTNIYMILKSFSSLKYIKNWFNQLNIDELNKNNNSLTKEFYSFLYQMYNNQTNKSLDLKVFKNLYEEKLKEMNTNILYDPYNFIYNFLLLLHKENNKPLNMIIGNNINIEIMKNEEMMYNLYYQSYFSSNNSIISQLFFYIVRKTIKCFNKCCPVIYDFECENIFIVDTDYYKNINPLKNNERLTLGYCLFKYIEKYQQMICNMCQVCTANVYKKIFDPSKVLIIYFKRNYHINKNDIIFPIDINISDYVCSKRKLQHPYYTLKSCIFYCEPDKYYTFTSFDNQWYKSTNEQSLIICNKEELYIYEPIIIIYELNENKGMIQSMPNIQMNIQYLYNYNQIQQNNLIFSAPGLNNLDISQQLNMSS
jgi:hypothetical protein